MKEPRPVQVIDWSTVVSRLQAASQAILRGNQSTPEQRQAILRQRARDLAEVPPAAPSAQTYMSVVGFRLGSKTFAIDSSLVAEVFSYRDIVPVPCTPNYILGLINARGQIISVTDLKVFLGIPPSDPTKESKILVLSSPQFESGVLVDSLYDVQEIVIETIVRLNRGPASDFIWGATPTGLTVIDANRLLADRRLVIGE